MKEKFLSLFGRKKPDERRELNYTDEEWNAKVAQLKHRGESVVVLKFEVRMGEDATQEEAAAILERLKEMTDSFTPEKRPLVKPYKIKLGGEWHSALPWCGTSHYKFDEFMADVSEERKKPIEFNYVMTDAYDELLERDRNLSKSGSAMSRINLMQDQLNTLIMQVKYLVAAQDEADRAARKEEKQQRKKKRDADFFDEGK